MTEKRSSTALLCMLGALYFAQGLPFGLLARSLPAIARDAGLAPSLIGLLALPAAPWALKFLWAPFVDQFGSGAASHRKRWIVGCHCLAMLLLLVIALQSPEHLFSAHFMLFLALLLCLNTVFATHDIATDGLAVRLLPLRLRGVGNSLQAGGYKVGLIVGGALLLLFMEQLGWTLSWLLVLFLLALALVPLWRYPEPADPRPAVRLDRRAWLAAFVGFWRRPGMLAWFLLLCGYRVCDSFGSRMLKPWLVDAGWTLSAIGTLDLVTSLVGLAGAALAGIALLRMPHRVALVVFGLAQALAFVGWGALAPDSPQASVWLVAATEQFADGLSTVALFTLMMDRCRPGHEGTDYTLQASLVVSVAGMATLVSGFSVEWLGYSRHFLLSAALGMVAIIPALFLPTGARGGEHVQPDAHR